MGKKSKKGGSKNGNGNSKPDEDKPAPTVAAPTAKSPAARLEAAQKDRFSQDFSQVVAVLMRAPNYKTLRIADLEWLVIPPLLAGQCKVALSRYQKDGPIVPVAVALWACVSESVDKRLSENADKTPVLRASEWTSGDIIWLITLAGEQLALIQFLPKLQKSVFKGRTVRMRVQNPGGKTIVQTLVPTAAAKV
jgi:cytolysin-activating lysine-acyltransferase